jgi:hypothetical protein
MEFWKQSYIDTHNYNSNYNNHNYDIYYDECPRKYVRNDIVKAYKNAKQIIGFVNDTVLISIINDIIDNANIFWITENNSFILDRLIDFMNVLHTNKIVTIKYPISDYTIININNNQTQIEIVIDEILRFRFDKDDQLYCVCIRIKRILKGITEFVTNCVKHYTIDDLQTSVVRNEISFAIKYIIHMSKSTFEYIVIENNKPNKYCITNAINSIFYCISNEILIYDTINNIIMTIIY